MQALRSTHVVAGRQQPTTVSFFRLLLSQVVSVCHFHLVNLIFAWSHTQEVLMKEILMRDHPSDPWPRTIPLSGPVSLDSEYAIKRGVPPQKNVFLHVMWCYSKAKQFP